MRVSRLEIFGLVVRNNPLRLSPITQGSKDSLRPNGVMPWSKDSSKMYGETQQPNLEKWHHFFAVRKVRNKFMRLINLTCFSGLEMWANLPWVKLGNNSGIFFFRKMFHKKASRVKNFSLHQRRQKVASRPSHKGKGHAGWISVEIPEV